MTMTSGQASTLREAVVGGIAAALDRAPAEIGDDFDLAELGLDSLDFTSILIEVEDRLGADVPAEVLDRLAEATTELTVGDLLGLFAGTAAAAPAWPPPDERVAGLEDMVVVIDGPG